jgi:hypothetical protein
MGVVSLFLGDDTDCSERLKKAIKDLVKNPFPEDVVF